MDRITVEHYQIPRTILRTEHGAIDIAGAWSQQECEDFVDAMRNRLYPHQVAETAVGAGLLEKSRSDRAFAMELDTLCAVLFGRPFELADPHFHDTELAH